MTVVLLPTRTSTQWAAAQDALREALPAADHPRLTEHAAMAERFHHELGQPTRVWANRIAAIAVIAERRAEVAPTVQRRTAYLDTAAAACALLLLAEQLHGVQPDDEALVLLARIEVRSQALI